MPSAPVPVAERGLVEAAVGCAGRVRAAAGRGRAGVVRGSIRPRNVRSGVAVCSRGIGRACSWAIPRRWWGGRARDRHHWCSRWRRRLDRTGCHRVRSRSRAGHASFRRQESRMRRPAGRERCEQHRPCSGSTHSRRSTTSVYERQYAALGTDWHNLARASEAGAQRSVPNERQRTLGAHVEHIQGSSAGVVRQQHRQREQRNAERKCWRLGCTCQ